MKRLVLAAAILSLLTVSCDAFKKGFNEGFTKNWRESFVKSCTEKDNSQMQQALCTCVANKAIKELTVKQLMDVPFATKWVQDTALPACQAPAP